MARQGRVMVETGSGRLEGIREDGLHVFKGIPYARPPVGPLRWAAPEPATPWSGTRPAGTFGPIAPQDARGTAIPGRAPSTEIQAEDCLFLNVWTPAADDARRAVMVWIHGGAFVHGSGSSPIRPGRTLPLRGGVVLVTINYRLGALGFLPLKQLAGSRIQATGNEALLDQILALQWVHDNIAAFGGDPNNVTVFGESAGAMSIGALLAMPQSRGLFQKAVLQSGASTFRPLDHAVKVAEKYLGILGLKASQAEELRALDAGRLMAAQRELALAGAPPGVRGANLEPVLDGEVLKEVPLDAVEHGSARNVTLLAGSNLEEGKLFAMIGPNLRDMNEDTMTLRLQRLLPDSHIPGLVARYRTALAKRDLPVTPYEIYVAIQGDQQFRMPNIRLCEIQERLGTRSFGYVFNWKSAAPGFGACHALDVGFVFGNLTDEFEGRGPAAHELAGNMQDAWIAFAKSGDPSCPGLGQWPRYGKDRKMMVLGEHSRVETAPYEAERAAWDGIENRLLG
jgi:para-nitrobenzyl esterase